MKTPCFLPSVCLLSLAATLSLSTANAANRTFIGGGTDQNFSTTANWDTFPVTDDSIFVRVAPTASNPALLDSAFNVEFTSFNLWNVDQVGTAQVTVQNGATASATTFFIGRTSSGTSFGGNLVLESGSSLENRFANSGFLAIGTTTNGLGDGDVGTVTVDDGASWQHTRLMMGSNATVVYEFGANSVSTFDATYAGATALEHRLDGLIRLDLSAFTVPGASTSYTLIDSSSLNLTIGGALKTDIDNGGGSIVGSGNFSSSTFEIINAPSSFDWELSGANGDQDLVFTAIPEPSSYSAFVGILAGSLLLLRRSNRDRS